MTVILDDATAEVFIKALRDPKLAHKLSYLAQNTDPTMPESIRNFAWQRINQTLGATIWGPAIVTEYEDEDDE